MPSKSGNRKRTGPGKKEPAPLVVGLTGNIGSGKSTAAGIFSELGVPTFDTDEIGHELLDSDSMVRVRITKDFGSGVADDGRVDRRKLGELVFNDPAKRRKLEEILHPAIMAAVRDRVIRQVNQGYAIVEVPLLYEAKLAGEFDYVVLVKAVKEIAVARASANLGIDKKEVLKRLATQIPQSEKEKLADFAVANNGTLDDLRERIRLLHSIISSLSPIEV